MNTTAVCLYGKKDLRMRSFDLPSIGEGEILAEIISDSICMSSYKAAVQGADHKRVPADIADHPVIIGHEFCGRILEVGKRWQDQFSPKDRFIIQPALNDPADIYAAPGYSFTQIGGAATRIIIPEVVMERGCLLKYEGEAYYHGSLGEPLSCIIGGFHVNYHTKAGSYEHQMGIVEGGSMALLAGAGPMGLGAIDYALHGPRQPGRLVVTDIDDARLSRVQKLYTPQHARECNVKLEYINTRDMKDVVPKLLSLNGGQGYDDVYVYAPVAPVVEQADQILGRDGCLNFFAGPTDPGFAAKFNFYNVHYNATHVAGNSGGNTDDLIEAIDLMAQKKVDPSAMITHVGGLDSVVDTTLRLPEIPGGKKLIYTQISMPLMALEDFAAQASKHPAYGPLADIIAQNDGVWSAEAEAYLLAHKEGIDGRSV